MQRLRLADVEADVAEIRALATTQRPVAGPPEVTVRPVETLEEMAEGLRIGWEAFGTPQEVRDLDLERRWRDRQESEAAVAYVAYLDGEPVGHALGVYCPLGVAQAAPTSEPILRRLGFDEVCRVRRLQDPA